MTAGTATAITGGQLLDPQKRPNVDDEAGSSIRGGTEQPLKPGDILYIPPGVAHGFKDVKGFRAFLIRFDTK
jgi:dTDP-4-dehydrorhamnose 3,5-epimerase-like enzyme